MSARSATLSLVSAGFSAAMTLLRGEKLPGGHGVDSKPVGVAGVAGALR